MLVRVMTPLGSTSASMISENHTLHGSNVPCVSFWMTWVASCLRANVGQGAGCQEVSSPPSCSQQGQICGQSQLLRTWCKLGLENLQEWMPQLYLLVATSCLWLSSWGKRFPLSPVWSFLMKISCLPTMYPSDTGWRRWGKEKNSCSPSLCTKKELQKG